jgi:simple sugar transport system substrate-binding protein
MTVTHRFLAIAFALAIAMLGVGSASAQKAKIGVIYPSPIGEVGWAHELDVGRQAIADKLGDRSNSSKPRTFRRGRMRSAS